MTGLEETPNIGTKLRADLEAAGIYTIEELNAVGVEGAWGRIREVNPERDCTHSLLALHGAMRGVRWMQLPSDERERLGPYARAERTV